MAIQHCRQRFERERRKKKQGFRANQLAWFEAPDRKSAHESRNRDGSFIKDQLRFIFCPPPFQHVSPYPLCFPLRRPRRLQRHPGAGAPRGRLPQSHLRGQQAPVRGVVMAAARPPRKRAERPPAHTRGVLQLPGPGHQQPDRRPLGGLQVLRPPPRQRKGDAHGHASGRHK